MEGYSCLSLERVGGGIPLPIPVWTGAPSLPPGYPLALTHTLVCLLRSEPFAATAPDLLSSLSDDTLRAGGQVGVSARRHRPRQGAEESAEGAPTSSPARRDRRRPPATDC